VCETSCDFQKHRRMGFSTGTRQSDRVAIKDSERSETEANLAEASAEGLCRGAAQVYLIAGRLKYESCRLATC